MSNCQCLTYWVYPMKCLALIFLCLGLCYRISISFRHLHFAHHALRVVQEVWIMPERIRPETLPPAGQIKAGHRSFASRGLDLCKATRVKLVLVGGDWNMTGLFSHILGIIIPVDELIFFRGVGQPPTRNDWRLR